MNARDVQHRPAPPPPRPRQRKIVQLTTTPHSNGGDPHLYAVANDGTAWELVASNWVQLPELPQEDCGCPR